MLKIFYTVNHKNVNYNEMFNIKDYSEELFEAVVKGSLTDDSCGIRQLFNALNKNKIGVAFKADHLCIDIIDRSVWIPSNKADCYLTVKFAE